MKNNRRDFIRKSTAMAALSVAGIGSATSGLLGCPANDSAGRVNGPGSKDYIQDAGIKMCFAYFGGIEAEKRKVQFGRQLNVLGAVGGIDPSRVGLSNARPWDYEAVMAVKYAWAQTGLNLEVIEGPPA